MKTFRTSDGAVIFLKSIIFSLAVQIVAGIVTVVLVMGNVIGEKGENILNLVFTVLLQGCFLLAYFTTKRKQKRVLPLGFSKVSVVTVIIALISSAICVFCFSHMAQWFDFLLQKIGFKTTAVLEFSTPVETVIVVIATVILAPVCEEIVFRGALFGGLLKRMKPIFAVLLSGACFALMHMNPEQTVYQFILGCVSAILAYYSGSLIPSVLLHAGSNLIAVIVTLATKGVDGEMLTPSGDYLITTLVGAVVGALVIFGFIAVLKRLNLKRERKIEQVEEQSVKSKNPLLNRLLLEEERDQIDEKEERIPSALLGHRSHLITTIITLGVCALMWLLMLVTGLTA